MTVFVSSACIMVLELVAGRLIARHVGMSLYTWTAVIGVIMLGISLGNHLGGRLADRYAPRRLLALLFFGAALACAAILPLNGFAGNLPLLDGANWPLRIFLHVFITFLCPSLLLGMIHPVVAKMALDLHRNAGRTVGGVFAWSVAGSLVGTFVSGYYLVMTWNASTILLFSGGGLALLGAIYVLGCLFHKGSAGASSYGTPAQEDRIANAALSAWAPAAATVFLSNAAFMAFELGAMRMVSREFGSSLYTWTMVIGIVLAGISLGNYLGGRLADRSFTNTCVALVFSVSALTVLLSPAWNVFVRNQRDEYLFLALFSWPAQIGMQVVAICFVPCVCIGMVSPILVRRVLEGGKAPGASVGMIYAWGSLGAILGTFLPGYWLIQWMGALPLVMSVALVLAVTALFYRPFNLVSLVVALLCVGSFATALLPGVPTLSPVARLLGLQSGDNQRIVYEDESQYSYIAILKDAEDPEIREMLLDQLVHTRIDMRDHTRLLYEYEWIYDAVMEKRHPRPQPVRALVIGGGGYAYPHYLETVRPGSAITVAEIDPAVTEAAHAALGLPRDTGMAIYDMDARNVVDDLIRGTAGTDNSQRFDYIFGDSINDYTVPYHLTTLEFNRRLHTLLKDDGMYLFNMIDMLDSGAFLAAVVNTCRQVFDQVTVFNTGRASFIRDTFVVICAKQKMILDDLPVRLNASHAYTGIRIENTLLDGLIDKHKGILLTDDFAPVENLLAPVVRTRAGDAGELTLNFARRDAARGDSELALKRCRQALAIHPKWPEAYEFLAQLLTERGDTDGAIDALANAVMGHPHPETAWYTLGKALFEAQRVEEAIVAWQECVKVKPDHVNALYNMGVAHGMRNALPAAVACFKKVLEYNPEHPDSLYNLAAAYVMMGDKAAASALVDKMRSLNQNIDPQLLDALK